MTKHLLVTRL